MADAGPQWESMLDYTALSDQGMRRTNNQDSHVEVLVSDRVSLQQRGHLFIVADGMGAHAAGAIRAERRRRRGALVARDAHRRREHRVRF